MARMSRVLMRLAQYGHENRACSTHLDHSTRFLSPAFAHRLDSSATDKPRDTTKTLRTHIQKHRISGKQGPSHEQAVPVGGVERNCHLGVFAVPAEEAFVGEGGRDDLVAPYAAS
eukprot:1765186-Rhodomonas_salina.1